MKKYIDIIKQCPLCTGIEEKDLHTLLKCLSATQKHYDKNEFVFSAGDTITTIGIVLCGSVHIIQEDFWGNRTILSEIERGHLFGEAFSCAGKEKIPVSVVASTPTDIMMIDYRKIITTCSSSCVFHTNLIKNMIRILASKNVMLTQKIEFLTQRSTRDKLLAYLSAQAQKLGKSKFEIPFNRQELADYLSVDRSAMSNELSKMRDEGILIYEKNRFELAKLT